MDILCITKGSLWIKQPNATPFSTKRDTFAKIINQTRHLYVVVFLITSKKKVSNIKALQSCQNCVKALRFPVTTEHDTFPSCILGQESSNIKGSRAFSRNNQPRHLSTKLDTFPFCFRQANAQESRFYAASRQQPNPTPLPPTILYYIYNTVIRILQRCLEKLLCRLLFLCRALYNIHRKRSQVCMKGARFHVGTRRDAVSPSPSVPNPQGYRPDDNCTGIRYG